MVFIESFTMYLNSQENVANSLNPKFANINAYLKKIEVWLQKLYLLLHISTINQVSFLFKLDDIV